MVARARPSATIPARQVLRIVNFCRARGHDAEALCRRVGLSLAALSEPEGLIGRELAARVFERALAVTGDEHFGLHLAQDVRDTGNFDAGVLLLMASPTVRAAFEHMARNQRYWGDADRARLVPVRGGLAVRYAVRDMTPDFERHADECAMAEIAIGVRVLAGPTLRAQAVRFRHSAPRGTDEHRVLFDCPLVFGARHTEIEFDDAALAMPMPHANEAFAAIFQRQVDRALERLPAAAQTSETVRVTVRSALAAGRCTLRATAKNLGVTSRTLQRRLREEGTSFGAIVDALRRELACAYLDRRMPVAEIASMLGYADATAFHHAFRRWTGSSPLRWTPHTLND